MALFQVLRASEEVAVGRTVSFKLLSSRVSPEKNIWIELDEAHTKNSKICVLSVLKGKKTAIFGQTSPMLTSVPHVVLTSYIVFWDLPKRESTLSLFEDDWRTTHFLRDRPSGTQDTNECLSRKTNKKRSRTPIFSVKAAQKWQTKHTAFDFKKEVHFWEKEIVNGDFDGRTQANVWNKTRDFSVQESCSSMKASIQNLIQEFAAVVLEKGELEFWDMSELRALLPLLAYQDSNSDVKIIF